MRLQVGDWFGMQVFATQALGHHAECEGGTCLDQGVRGSQLTPQEGATVLSKANQVQPICHAAMIMPIPAEKP